MVLINKGESNTIVLTLSENVTISNPYYLMVLYGKSDEATIKWLLTDSSTYPARYNEFTFEEGVDVTIPYKGDYIYKVYQKATADTNIPSEANLLETGLARVVDGDNLTEYSPTGTKDSIIYENEE